MPTFYLPGYPVSMCICYYPDVKLTLVWSKKHGVWIELDQVEAETKVLPTRAYPAYPGPIVIPGGPGKQGELVIGQWGSIPFWASDASFGKKSGYNARSETLLEKPTWRKAFLERRCVVPIRAFYERDNGRWLRFMRSDGDLMAVAGLFEDPNKFSDVPTYALVTTDPNEVVSQIHDRMPVVLNDEDMRLWLEPQTELNELRALLAPSGAAGMLMQDAGPIRKPGELKGALEPL
ncbi:MAG TPA: SOS response-associated peptidase [Fimbriimonas sp.]|nr:SOS response-associated peptidase [Fimbriimonas sp.]